MYLENIVFRKLLRAIIATSMVDLKAAYTDIINRFGLDENKAIEVGKFIWKKRKEKPFDSAGYEEIPMKILQVTADNLIAKNEDVTIGGIMHDYLHERYPIGKSTSRRELPKSLRYSLHSKYGLEDLRDRLKEVYEDLNAAYNAKEYLLLIEDKDAQKKLGLTEYLKEDYNEPDEDILKSEKWKGPEIPEYEGLPKLGHKFAFSYQPLRQLQLNVMLKYLDYFEN